MLTVFIKSCLLVDFPLRKIFAVHYFLIK